MPNFVWPGREIGNQFGVALLCCMRMKQWLPYHFENLYGKFNSISITTRFNALFIAALIWRKGSTKTGEVSEAQALSQVVS